MDLRWAFVPVFLIGTYFILYRSGSTQRLWESIVSLIFLGLMPVLYVRFLVFDLSIGDPSDEHQYVTIAKDIESGKVVPVSGAGFLRTILSIHSLTGIDQEVIVALLGMLIGGLFILFLYLSYATVQGYGKDAMLTCLVILMTSYLLWPMIEGRPQQLGMVLVLAGTLLHQGFLKGKLNSWPFLALALFTFYFHILSFLILIGLCLILWWADHIEKGSEVQKAVPAVSMLALGAALFYVPVTLYRGTAGGIKWMLLNSSVDYLADPRYLLAGLALVVFSVIAFTLIVKKFAIIPSFERFLARRRTPVIVTIAIALVTALLLQFFMDKDVYISKYRGSFLLFSLFQVSNVIFGALFLMGLYRSMGERNYEDPFLRASLGLMVIGVVTVAVSIFLPVDFNNWLIRTINYWTLFSAPVVFSSVMRLGPRLRKVFFWTLPVLIFISLLNISRDPTFVGFP